MRGALPQGQFDITAEINVTPMIDVMLVLLIIFMVVTPAMLLLPSANTALAERDAHPTLVIDAGGGYSLDLGSRLEAIAPSALALRLASVYAARPNDHVLYLKADRRVPYPRVLDALDAARTAGVRRIGAITERPPAQPHSR
jgi:biopolymer transport protein ExbD